MEEARQKLEKMNAWIQQQTILSQGIIETGSELSLFIQVWKRNACLRSRCEITAKRRWILFFLTNTKCIYVTANYFQIHFGV